MKIRELGFIFFAPFQYHPSDVSNGRYGADFIIRVHEGNQNGSEAASGECSWNSAQSGALLWSIPGLWPNEKDINKTVLASATKINSSDIGRWIRFNFNSDGIKRLQAIIDGSPNYGWLIRQANEENMPPRLRFYSSDAEHATDIPYIEITYTLPR